MAEKKWKVGDSYTVIEYGLRVKGKIIEITPSGYRVLWNDGQETIESKPDPAQGTIR